MNAYTRLVCSVSPTRRIVYRICKGLVKNRLVCSQVVAACAMDDDLAMLPKVSFSLSLLSLFLPFSLSLLTAVLLRRDSSNLVLFDHRDAPHDSGSLPLPIWSRHSGENRPFPLQSERFFPTNPVLKMAFQLERHANLRIASTGIVSNMSEAGLQSGVFLCLRLGCGITCTTVVHHAPLSQAFAI